MTTHIAHFVVHGDFITDTARRLWNEEDEPERAMNILRCMQGITDAQCLDVLEGRSKLTGDSSKGILLKPDKKKGKTVTDVIRKLKQERDEARDERADLQEMVIGKEATEILASPTGLRRVPRRKTQRKYIKGSVRTVLADDVEFDDVLDNPETPAVPGRGTKPLHVWQQVSPTPGQFRAEKIIMDNIEEEKEEIPPPPEPQTSITSPTGWLSPDGKFYPCCYSQHALTAWKLRLTDNPQNHWVKPDGWIRLSKDGKDQLFFPDETDTHTPAQREVIQTYCQELGIELPWWLRKEKP